jgi:hypothetical protein
MDFFVAEGPGSRRGRQPTWSDRISTPQSWNILPPYHDLARPHAERA